MDLNTHIQAQLNSTHAQLRTPGSRVFDVSPPPSNQVSGKQSTFEPVDNAQQSDRTYSYLRSPKNISGSSSTPEFATIERIPTIIEQRQNNSIQTFLDIRELEDEFRLIDLYV